MNGSKNELRWMLVAPRVAWPTLAVLAGALACWCGGAWLGSTHRVPAWLAVLLAALGAYAAFTPLHEAAHRSLARSRLLCEVVGRLAGVPLLGPFAVVRHLHLEHHKHTNDPERDPDFWSGQGPRWALPLRWCTQDLHYYGRVARRWRSFGRAERIDAVVTLLAYAGVATALVWSGHGALVVWYWIVPSRLAIAFLAYAFDYVPHRPHDVLAKDDRHRATKVIDSRLLNVLLFGQSHHLVHHLYPGAPFYRYRSIWKRVSVVANRVRLSDTAAGRSPRVA